jgi:Spy/CpxP family protein refolding chaperone
VNRRARIVAVLLLLLTFSVGAVGGMAVEEALGLDWFEFLDEDYRANDRIVAGLNLTREQEERVERILDRQEEQLEDYWKSRLPEIQSMLQASYAEIRVQLTPEQRVIFDRRVRKLEGRVPKEMRD